MCSWLYTPTYHWASPNVWYIRYQLTWRPCLQNGWLVGVDFNLGNAPGITNQHQPTVVPSYPLGGVLKISVPVPKLGSMAENQWPIGWLGTRNNPLLQINTVKEALIEWWIYDQLVWGPSKDIARMTSAIKFDRNWTIYGKIIHYSFLN